MLGLRSFSQCCALLVLLYSQHIRFVYRFEFSILYLQLLLFVHPFAI